MDINIDVSFHFSSQAFVNPTLVLYSFNSNFLERCSQIQVQTLIVPNNSVAEKRTSSKTKRRRTTAR